MIKVSSEVCESVLSQLDTSPVQRTEEMLEKLRDENPEFIKGMSNIFAAYMIKNEQCAGMEFSPEVIMALAHNAALFSAISWNVIQKQVECNELNSEVLVGE